MFQMPLYRDFLENKHIWYHFQMIEFSNASVSVTYLEYRTPEEACWAKEKIAQSNEIALSETCAHVVENYVIHVFASGEETQSKLKLVFDLIDHNAKEAGLCPKS